MNKGFTLVELLAVLILLSIILLITIPIVQTTIKASKEEAHKASIELYGRAVNNAVKLYHVKNHQNPKSYSDIEEYIEYNGDKVECSTKNVNDDMTVYLANCTVDGKQVEGYSYGTEEVNKYIYIWYEGTRVNGPALNSTINPLDYSETKPTNTDWYLKLKIDKNNKVTEGYACATYTEDEYCIKGWDLEAYNENIEILRGLNGKGLTCSFNDNNASCDDGSINLFTNNEGYASVDTNEALCEIASVTNYTIPYCVRSQ